VRRIHWKRVVKLLRFLAPQLSDAEINEARARAADWKPRRESIVDYRGNGATPVKACPAKCRHVGCDSRVVGVADANAAMEPAGVGV
jgi:hypothetical protein